MLDEHKKKNWRLDADAMVEDFYMWYETKREIEDSEPLSQLYIPHEDTLCLIVDDTNIGDILVLINDPEDKKRTESLNLILIPLNLVQIIVLPIIFST